MNAISASVHSTMMSAKPPLRLRTADADDRRAGLIASATCETNAASGRALPSSAEKQQHWGQLLIARSVAKSSGAPLRGCQLAHRGGRSCAGAMANKK
jgi:hypothetical protein